MVKPGDTRMKVRQNVRRIHSLKVEHRGERVLDLIETPIEELEYVLPSRSLLLLSLEEER